MTKPSLEGAYALTSSDGNQRLYADWAETYDADFAADMDFLLPRHVAEAFAVAHPGGPVLDFGAGTGLVGEELAQRGIGDVDALDVSAEMLAVAGGKGVYRSVLKGDLLAGYQPPGRYLGIVSSGTFTLGHVGPDALGPLLDVAQDTALFVLTINSEHFAQAGFDAAFQRIGPRISDLCLKEVPIYGAGGARASDTAVLAEFRKVAEPRDTIETQGQSPVTS